VGVERFDDVTGLGRLDDVTGFERDGEGSDEVEEHWGARMLVFRFGIEQSKAWASYDGP
jgi:hypothetical protein